MECPEAKAESLADELIDAILWSVFFVRTEVVFLLTTD